MHFCLTEQGPVVKQKHLGAFQLLHSSWEMEKLKWMLGQQNEISDLLCPQSAGCKGASASKTEGKISNCSLPLPFCWPWGELSLQALI